MSTTSYRHQSIALAVTVLMGLYSAPASALSLGALTVQSTLGEPLQAEVEVLSITSEEAESLVIKVASAEAFQAAGLQYSDVLNDLEVTLQKRPDGSSYLQLRSKNSVAEPFIEMLLDTSWSSGHVLRNYALLLDPPLPLNQPNDATSYAELPAATPIAIEPDTNIDQLALTAPPDNAATSGTKTFDAPIRLKVETGSTAGAIATTYKEAGVSLDQMLVALLRANPNAFINDNVNLIKAGAVVTIPNPEQASAIEAGQARQIVRSQSRDFNAYRRKLASNVGSSQTAAGNRNLSGDIKSEVKDDKTELATPDKLTLSQGSVQAKSEEEMLAEQRNSEAAQARSVELNKNIAELEQIAAQASGTATPPVDGETAAAGTATPVDGSTASDANSEVSQTDAATATETPAAQTPLTVAPPAPAAPPPPEPSFIETLLANQLLLGAAAVIIALLAGLGLYRRRQKKIEEQFEFFENDSPLDFAGGNQGEDGTDNPVAKPVNKVQTQASNHFDTKPQTDPLTEAEACLSYGNDVEAEKILKEALQVQPKRLPLQQKLLDIYAQRRDIAAFAATADAVHKLTKGMGSAWTQVCRQGLSIDPNNPLYLPAQAAASPAAAKPVTPAKLAPVLSVKNVAATPKPDAKPDLNAPIPKIPDAPNLDLDLDFSIKNKPDQPVAAVASKAAPAASQPPLTFVTKPAASAQDQQSPLDVPWDKPSQDLQDDNDDTGKASSEPEVGLNPKTGMDSQPPEWLTLAGEDQVMVTTPGVKPPPLESNEDSSAFDFSKLSLDTEYSSSADEQQQSANNQGLDPIETKLALAEEFMAIGNFNAARTLLEEVVASAEPELKAKAQNALAKL